MKRNTKKFLALFVSLLLFISFCSCAAVNNDEKNDNSSKNSGSASISQASSTQASPSSKPEGTDGKGEASNDVLIAYFSCTGNTAQMADYIAAEVGGDLFSINPSRPYTDEDLDYSNSKCRSKQEQMDPKARVEILDKISNFNSYKTIYLGFPIWYDDAPKIIYSFLESYDFSGKTIIPFCTSAQTDIADSEANIKKIAPKAKWKKGKRFSPSAFQNDITKWIKNGQ